MSDHSLAVPTPLRDAFKSVASARAFIGSLVTAVVGWGLLTGVQGDAIVGLLGTLPAVITAVTALLAAFGVVTTGEPQVTPTVDPGVIDEDGVRVQLVRAS